MVVNFAGDMPRRHLGLVRLYVKGRLKENIKMYVVLNERYADHYSILFRKSELSELECFIFVYSLGISLKNHFGITSMILIYIKNSISLS